MKKLKLIVTLFLVFVAITVFGQRQPTHPTWQRVQTIRPHQMVDKSSHRNKQDVCSDRGHVNTKRKVTHHRGKAVTQKPQVCLPRPAREIQQLK